MGTDMAPSLVEAAVAVSPRPHLPNPVDPGRHVSAVLFDLDGTLYDQRRLRLFMAVELAALPLHGPFKAWRVWQGLGAYRRAQEAIRLGGGVGAQAQLDRGAAAANLVPNQLRRIVDEWMLERPLKYLSRCRAAGLVDLLAFLSRAGLELGVLSDYPVDAKLRALGVAESFALTVCASDPAVDAFKPHPRGFLAAAARWKIDPSEILVVGDRPEVDAAGALAAGMPSVIVGRAPTGTPAGDVLFLSSLERLHRVLDGRG